MGLGMILSSQFVALSAAKPEANVATSVTTFYLFQQIGFMAGVTSSRALVRSAMESGLKATLGNIPGSREVSQLNIYRSYRCKILTITMTDS